MSISARPAAATRMRSSSGRNCAASGFSPIVRQTMSSSASNDGAVAAGGEAKLAARGERQPQDLRRDEFERRAVARLEHGAAAPDEEGAKARRAVETGGRPDAFGERRFKLRRDQRGAMGIGLRARPARRELGHAPSSLTQQKYKTNRETSIVTATRARLTRARQAAEARRGRGNERASAFEASATGRDDP